MLEFVDHKLGTTKHRTGSIIWWWYLQTIVVIASMAHPSPSLGHNQTATQITENAVNVCASGLSKLPSPAWRILGHMIYPATRASFFLWFASGWESWLLAINNLVVFTHSLLFLPDLFETCQAVHYASWVSPASDVSFCEKKAVERACQGCPSRCNSHVVIHWFLHLPKHQSLDAKTTSVLNLETLKA